MIFISNSEDLSKTFEELCKKYDQFEWAVAWAGDSSKFKQGQLLEKYKDKVGRLIVGLHFYQTSPTFIDKFMDMPSVRFIKQTDGTFHTKIYLFYNSKNDWKAIVGSSNFTDSGFNHNYEANVLMSSKDENINTFEDIRSYIDKLWKQASSFAKDELADYLCCWENVKHSKDSLSHSRITKGKFDTSDFDIMSWDKFKKDVESFDRYQDRIKLLRRAQSLFHNKHKHKHFMDLDLKDRKRLSGIPTREENDGKLNWKSFGSMKGCGYFKQAIIEGNEHIANAIDLIPISGVITKEMYKQYCDEFTKAFKNIKNPLATATRLLAMKRPDVFICLNKENKKQLCKKFKIPQSKLTIDTYWDLLIERIRQDVWFRSPDDGSELKKFQVAMLDCLYYE